MAHRDEFSLCPACSAALQATGARLVCASCGGQLVTDAELEKMMNEMSPDDQRPVERRLLAGSGTARTCPRCSSSMTPHTMNGFPAARCSEHGVWFDSGKLERVLNANGQLYAARRLQKRDDGEFDPFGLPFAPLRAVVRIVGKGFRWLAAPMQRKRYEQQLAADIARTSPPPGEKSDA